jgi:hypothetical protein
MNKVCIARAGKEKGAGICAHASEEGGWLEGAAVRRCETRGWAGKNKNVLNTTQLECVSVAQVARPGETERTTPLRIAHSVV